MDQLLVAGFSKACAFPGCSAVLPDDGRCDRRKRASVPQDERLALVGDADRFHVAGFGARRFQRAARADLDGGPDFVGIVLDPSRMRVVLGDLLVTLAPHLTVEANGDCRRPGRALVQTQDDFADVGFQVRLRLPVE